MGLTPSWMESKARSLMTIITGLTTNLAQAAEPMLLKGMSVICTLTCMHLQNKVLAAYLYDGAPPLRTLEKCKYYRHNNGNQNFCRKGSIPSDLKHVPTESPIQHGQAEEQGTDILKGSVNSGIIIRKQAQKPWVHWWWNQLKWLFMLRLLRMPQDSIHLEF